METVNPTWQQLLVEAVMTPGKISTAYSRFWNYSSGNQMLALWQCAARGIEVGPIASFMHWKELGRYVRKGEKAIALCMPVTIKAKGDKVADAPEGNAPATFTKFIYRNNWFALSQTDGAEYTPEPIPGWDEAIALAALDVQRVLFALPDGNCQGYATGRTIAVSPVAALPHKTTFHEIAHVVIGHTSEGLLTDSEHTPRTLREVEAEAVALICIESLGLPGAEFSRGYIQAHLCDSEIPERSAQRIFKAADSILKAGRATTEASASE